MNESPSLLHVAPSDRKELARRALIAAATTMLQTTPADQLNIVELTRQAGVSRPTFYRHFDNPPTLVRVAVLAKLQASFATALSPETPSNWIPAARTTIHQLLTELHSESRFYLHAIQGPVGLQLIGDVIEFLDKRILEDSPLAPVLRASSGEATAKDRTLFLSAGIACFVIDRFCACLCLLHHVARNALIGRDEAHIFLMNLLLVIQREHLGHRRHAQRLLERADHQ